MLAPHSPAKPIPGGNTDAARVATFNQLPGGLDDTAVKLPRDTVMAQPGVRVGIDPDDVEFYEVFEF